LTLKRCPTCCCVRATRPATGHCRGGYTKNRLAAR
jgi:hypothetical protein